MNKKIEKLILSPYVRVGIQNNILYVGFGSIQKKIKSIKSFEIILKSLLFFKSPKTMDQFENYLINQLNVISPQREEIIKLMSNSNFLIKKNDFNESDKQSRNHLYYLLAGCDPTDVQKRLENAHVIILGCGGIGNMISILLTTLNIGKLTLVDEDIIELSNLPRQILFTTKNVGSYKVDVMSKTLKKYSESTKINSIQTFINSETINNLPEADLIVLSADSYDCIPLVNEYCLKRKIPFINVGYVVDVGVYGPFVIPGKTGCFFCQGNIVSLQGDGELSLLINQINEGFKAPSFGAINMLSSSLAVLDIVRYLGQYGEIQSLNKRIGLWTNHLNIEIQLCHKNPDCQYCKNV